MKMTRRKISQDDEKGAGFRDFFNKIKNTLSGVVDKVASIPTNIINKALPEKQQYTRKADTMLARYGHFKIIQLFVERQQVNNAVMKLSNVLTVGEMNDSMKKNGIEKYFHLNLKAIILSATGQNITMLIEKNDTINIDIWKQKPDIETIEIDLQGQRITITELLTRTRIAIGNQAFFLYRALDGQNCGDFCIAVLKANNIWKQDYYPFMFQDTELLKKHISKNSQNRLNMITKLGSLFTHMKGGNLEPQEIRFI